MRVVNAVDFGTGSCPGGNPASIPVPLGAPMAAMVDGKPTICGGGVGNATLSRKCYGYNSDAGGMGEWILEEFELTEGTSAQW